LFRATSESCYQEGVFLLENKYTGRNYAVLAGTIVKKKPYLKVTKMEKEISVFRAADDFLSIHKCSQKLSWK
jgi:hypothetical protein